MSPDGIVFATLTLATIGALAWCGIRRSIPPGPLTPDQQKAAALQSTEDTFFTIVGDHIVEATPKSGRKPWQ